MNLPDIIKNRRSVRVFEDREISASAIDVLIGLFAGRRAQGTFKAGSSISS
jgi:nitroreductase